MTLPGGQFFEEFIDDFFSESDEHLGTVRRVLLDLEAIRSGPAPDGELHELSRALHTLKGLSGMVGLGAAEEIAHAMEDAVNALRGAERIPPELLETLFVGETLLERAVAMRRERTTPPSPGPYVDRVRDVLRMVSGTDSRAPKNDRRELTRAGVGSLQDVGNRLCRFEFVPSAGLAARGVGVEMIRQRLGALGEIKSTTPRVRDTGGLSFEFVVALAPGALPDESWRADGLAWDSLAESGSALGVVVHEPASAPSAPATTASNVVRVDLARLDDLMRMVGELVVSRARLEASLTNAGTGLAKNVEEDLLEANALIERQIRTIREGVMRIRLVSIGEVFERMRFAMRDIARETGKEIHLEFSGQETEIDKLIVDRMLEPLLHLVRNAASHGIEPRSEREAAGKAPEGTIWLRARAAGDRILLEVEDDGAGIDVERVGRRARDMDLHVSGEGIGSDAVLDVICSPGFSTREVADMASGRGIGMAVVRTTVRALGGDLFVDSVAGHGTRFTIELPLTLMITDALIVGIGDQLMAIPQASLREILPLDSSSVTPLENNEVISYRGRVVPLLNLASVFNLPAPNETNHHVLIVGNDLHLTGLVVGRVIGLREIVVHPVADPLIAVPGIAGATELADGRVSLILDAAALVRGSRARAIRSSVRGSRAPLQDGSSARALGEGDRTWA